MKSTERRGVAQRVIRKIEMAREITRIAHLARWRAGRHLVEKDLCAALGVSRSPIRAGLGVLEEWGFVERRPNQGYFLLCDAEQLSTLEHEVPASIHEDLLMRIVRSQLAGTLPQTITQAALMKVFDESRVNIAKVLSKMTTDGLVSRRKGRGWQFCPTFRGSISWAHSYQFRLIVEPAAILLPQFKVKRAALDKCYTVHQRLLNQDSFDNIDLGWIFGIDNEFHELVASFSRNSSVIQAIQNQNQLRRTLEYYGYYNKRRIKEWCLEHLRIIEALQKQNNRKASFLMQQHLRNATKEANSILIPERK